MRVRPSHPVPLAVVRGRSGGPSSTDKHAMQALCISCRKTYAMDTGEGVACGLCLYTAVHSEAVKSNRQRFPGA
jgi:hypothetical protein